MGNRTSRRLRPGQHNLRGKKSAVICPCCDRMMNHKNKILEAIHRDDAKYFDEEKEENLKIGVDESNGTE